MIEPKFGMSWEDVVKLLIDEMKRLEVSEQIILGDMRTQWKRITDLEKQVVDLQKQVIQS